MKRSHLVAALFAVFTLSSNLQAELITINIGSSGFNIGGINAGITEFGYSNINNFPISGDNMLTLYNNFSGYSGLMGGLFALNFAAGGSFATPVNFALNASIGSGINYTGDAESLFKFGSDYSSPDFGAGSYMGFVTSQGNYGWLEVTWKASTTEFRILSGAYESDVGVAILAGGGAAPIPEPGTWAAMAIFAGGAAFAGWRRRKSAKVA